jgi:hypothetical protein
MPQRAHFQGQNFILRLGCTISGFVLDVIDSVGPRQGDGDVAEDVVEPRYDRRSYETDMENYAAILGDCDGGPRL